MQICSPGITIFKLRSVISPRSVAKVKLERFRLPSCAIASTANSSGYWTLTGKYTVVTEVKKSKFVATGWPIHSSAQALQIISEARDTSASHNCYAYKHGTDFRSSDDGEPGGTAGRPILSSIEGEGLDATCVVVTRYFGGIKLGAGGLVRAYGGATRVLLREAPRILVRPNQELYLQAPFDQTGVVYQLLEQYRATRVNEQYSNAGELRLVIKVEVSLVDKLRSALLDATSGKVYLHDSLC